MKPSSLFDLSGKTALTTGCDRGIGQAMALEPSEAGADILGVSHNGTIVGGETEAEITSLGRSFIPYVADLSNREADYHFIAQVRSAGTPMDTLLNNAGMILRKPVFEHPDEWWDKVFCVNLDGKFLLTREFGRNRIERGGGKIVFACSLLSFQRRQHQQHCPGSQGHRQHRGT